MNQSVYHWKTTYPERIKIFKDGYAAGKLEAIKGEFIDNPHKGITTWRHAVWYRGWKKGWLDYGGEKYWKGKP